MMKQQIFLIHGGSVFKSYEDYIKYLSEREIDFERFLKDEKDWKGNLKNDLSNKFDVIVPSMPCKQNAKYIEWKIWFDKFVPYLKDDIILIGHSLGGTFLVKYLSENIIPKKVKALFLIAPAFSEGEDESLDDFIPFSDFSKVKEQAKNIFIYGSEDDQVVPFSDFEKFKKELDSAVFRKFKNEGHFNSGKISKLIEDILSLD